jgi:arginine deiminase
MWTLNSETGVLRDVLLCKPEHYRWIPTNSIALATLAGGNIVEPHAASVQYRELEAVLDQAGVARHYLKPEAHLPYQVYTRDSSQTTPWGPVLTQLAMPQRRGEYAALLEFHAKTGGFWHYATEGTVEGGDIHIIRQGLLVIGHSGGRTSEAGAQQFAAWFEAEGWEVRLEPFAEHFLHLDVLFCMAAEGLAVACTEVLGDDFSQFLAKRQIRIIAASYAEVMAMSCNLLSLGGGRVISPAHSKRLNAALRAEGIMVFDPELDCFARGGGSIHCMTMPLRRN